MDEIVQGEDSRRKKSRGKDCNLRIQLEREVRLSKRVSERESGAVRGS